MTLARRLRLVGGLLLSLVVFLAGCGPGSAEVLVRERCTVCHTLAPIEAAQKTRQDWERTVYRMIGRGARLNKQEAEQVILYLTETRGPR